MCCAHVSFVQPLKGQDVIKDAQDAGSTAAAAAADYYGDVGGGQSSSDKIQKAEEDGERSRDVCVGQGQQDDRVIFTTTVFTRLCTRCRLLRLQHQEFKDMRPVQLRTNNLRTSL